MPRYTSEPSQSELGSYFKFQNGEIPSFRAPRLFVIDPSVCMVGNNDGIEGYRSHKSQESPRIYKAPSNSTDLVEIPITLHIE
jgi:hypothetical protein